MSDGVDHVDRPYSPAIKEQGVLLEAPLTAKVHDFLRFEDYADVIAEHILAPNAWPVGVGIFAKWGAGKVRADRICCCFPRGELVWYEPTIDALCFPIGASRSLTMSVNRTAFISHAIISEAVERENPRDLQITKAIFIKGAMGVDATQNLWQCGLCVFTRRAQF